MKHIFYILISFIFFNQLAAEIKEIHHIKDLEEWFVPLTSSDWVLFDIDYTLTEPTDPVLQMSTIKKNKQHFQHELAKFSEEEKKLIPTLMVTHGPNKLIDCSVITIIQKLHDRNIFTLGFTGLQTSVLPDIGSLPTWRSKELEQLGILFLSNETSPFSKGCIEFTEFPSFRGTFPLYQEGILYSNVTQSKGAVLTALMNKVSKKPTKLILVDDSLENLQSVEEAMTKQNIPFIGIHCKFQMYDSSPLTISDDNWNATWNKMLLRAKKLTPLEGILQASTIAPIEWAIQSLPEDSLVIFDVGNVLFFHKDCILAFNHKHWIKEWFERSNIELNYNVWRKLSFIIDREAERILVNPSLPRLINEAKQFNKVIALTLFWCGTSDNGETFEKQRLNSLTQMGINFDEPFPHAAGWCHEELVSTYANGILQTETPLKGPVLKAFLEQIAWIPKAIVFVDDRQDQCESIFETAKELKIPTLCIRYTEAIDQARPLDSEIADLQLKTLVNELHWISEETARKKLDIHIQ